MQAPSCLNCGTSVASNQNFCANCGQKARTHRLSLHDVGHDLLHYFTHADKGIFSLLKQLAIKPGFVSREYVEGKRRKYFPPINFFLIVAALYVFMINVMNTATNAGSVTPNEKLRFERIKDLKEKEVVAKILERRATSTKFLGKYSNFIAMIATPLISFFLWLFYKKGQYNYTEHLVANLYISGFTVLCFAFVFNPLVSVTNSHGFSSLLLLYFVFEISYRAISYYYFMNQKTRASAIKAALSSTAVILIWFVITYTLIYLYISSGFGGLLS
jgi:hypothetical protein